MKILIIGYGSIGKRHASLLKIFPGKNEIELVTAQNIKEYKCYKLIKDMSGIGYYLWRDYSGEFNHEYIAHEIGD